MNQEKPEYWHRIDFTQYAPPLDQFDRPYGEGTVGLNHHRYRVLKTCSKGVWLDIGGFDLNEPNRRFVLFDSKKQWASPTFEQAKEKFKHRKGRQIAILQAQINSIRKALNQLDAFKSDDHDHSFQGGCIPETC